MEFLDYIKEDYMVLRKCIMCDEFIDFYFFGVIPYDITEVLRDQLKHLNRLRYKFKFYWKEMAEFDYELNQNNLKIDNDFNILNYDICNCEFTSWILTDIKGYFKNTDINNYNYGYGRLTCFYYHCFQERLEIFTYDYDKIREAKWQLNKEILENMRSSVY
jgi:hypothetical protein